MSERLSKTTEQGAVDCLNAMWRLLRTKGVESISEDWRVDSLHKYEELGLEWWVDVPEGVVEGVLGCQTKMLIAPDSREEEPWLDISILATHVERLTATKDRERALLRVADGPLRDAIAVHGAVGQIATFDTRWLDLASFLDTWANMKEVREHVVRYWFRMPELSEFDRRKTELERARV